MLHLSYALAAFVVACLAGGVATGQPTSPARSTQINDAAPAQASASASAGVNVSVTVSADGARHLLISNQPVADTRENRAKYGQPLSNAGRHTRPAGN